jgi:RNA polymerase sigma-70 factor (ECF subfamily)
MEVLRDEAADTAAWGEFVRIYGPPVVAWCRERGLQHDDALDVTQDVLLRFWRASKQFDYDSRGRFRSYLEQVARSALVSWAEKAEAAHDQATRSLLEKIPDREGLLARLGEAYDTELVAIAMAEVKTRVRPHTWQAFELLALEHRSGADVAATRHDIDHSGRDPRCKGGVREAEGGERRELRGLDDNGAARSKAGAHFPRRHHQRKIKGADGGDDAHWLVRH